MQSVNPSIIHPHQPLREKRIYIPVFIIGFKEDFQVFEPGQRFPDRGGLPDDCTI
jgi:hypothetical protein